MRISTWDITITLAIPYMLIVLGLITVIHGRFTAGLLFTSAFRLFGGLIPFAGSIALAGLIPFAVSAVSIDFITLTGSITSAIPDTLMAESTPLGRDGDGLGMQGRRPLPASRFVLQLAT